MRTHKRVSLCPSLYCVHPNPAQTLMSLARAEKLGEPAIDGCIVCSACGSVYTRDMRGQAKVLGQVVSQGKWERWKSAYPRPIGAAS